MSSAARARVTDAIIAAAVAGVLALVVAADRAGTGDVRAYAWTVALGALMFWRRRYALTVLFLTVLGLFAYYVAGFPAIGVAVPVAAALYAAAEAGRRTAAIGVAAFVLLGSTTYRLLDGQDFRYVVLYEGIGHLALMAAAIALGELVRARRTLLDRQHRIDALTRAQAALEADRRMDEHLLELSRELHDSIGHTLTVAAVHTNVARQENGHRPDASVRAALDHVSAALTEALTQLRSTVRKLRAEAVRPSLADLDPLLRAARAAGFEVRTDVPDDLPAPAFRLIREAMTNAVRHSGGALIEVRVRRAGDVLEVSVRDDGTGTAPAAEGAGLTGMRERVTELGGRLEAGPAGDGWLVRAELPAAVTG